MSTNAETIDRIDRRYYSNINHALVDKAKTLAHGICVMKGIMNERMKQEVISTSDQNAEFIDDNDVSNKNCCVASMKEMNAALEVKVKEMEKTMQAFTDFACRGL
jgi:hypothetical protein